MKPEPQEFLSGELTKLFDKVQGKDALLVRFNSRGLIRIERRPKGALSRCNYCGY